ncbi:type II secretion system F family protein [Kineococcus sp. SYSU DK006]|uniref:type II secretion system F family protein n=1 Tax=Kineococcus sp. SYSU DK006 TaxID=3383127 RepID=UPI003D7DF56F
MSPAGTGLLLGSLCGAGCWLLARALPVRRAPALEDRVGPYLGARGGGPGDRLRTALLAAGARAGGALGSTEVVRRRLAVLDPDRDPAQHRAEQVLWAFAGVALAALAAAALAARGQVHPVGVLALLLAGGLGGALLRDRVLAGAVRRRRAEVLEDLPAVAELLALSVGAGENVAAALERVAAGGGPLCAQLRRALGEVRTGTPLLEALAALADRLGVGALDRFVDGLAVAVEAGSPLAEVLRAQAGDVREAQRRRLLEEGGRREVQMLVPVVFGVLPVTVVFAVLPGLAQLQLG